jgi:hypothetical protein
MWIECLFYLWNINLNGMKISYISKLASYKNNKFKQKQQQPQTNVIPTKPTTQ